MFRTLTPVKHPLFALIAFTLCVCFPTHTRAQETNDQEAQRLKTSFQRLLDYQKNVNEILGSVDITYDGELTVSRQPTYYTLTFPHIYISNNNKFDNANEDPSEPAKQVFDFGSITINAMADDKPGYWKIVLTLPEKFALYDALKASGDPDLFSLNIGEQRSIALYSEKLGYFTKADINLSGLTFLVGGQKAGIELGGIQFYSKMEEQENGKFSGPGHVLLNNLHVSPPDQNAKVDIEELKLAFDIGDVVLPTIEEYQQKILKHKDTFKRLQDIEKQDDKEAEAISAQNVFDMLADMYDFDMDRFSFAYSTKNVDIKDSTDEVKTMHIASGRFGAGASGLKSDKGTLSVDINYEGFETTPADPEISDLVPQNMSTKLEAKDVPFTTLSTLTSNTLQSIAQNPGAAQMAWLGVVMRLPAIVSQAGTQIVIDQNNISNHIYDVTLDGNISTDMSSMTGFAAKFNMLFEGLEALLSISEKHGANESSPNANEYKQLIPTLNKLKTIGKPATGKNNNPAYSYDIELGQQGTLTINGHDVQTVFGNQPEQ
jgi:hypothetical protein